jgi:hypothetical protein
MDLINHYGTPKQWAHKNDPKRQNNEFLVMPLKYVLSVMDLVNHSGTPKLWVIAHENGPKMQKRQVFGHASQISTDCYIPCKSLWKPQNNGQ